jgi:hypothetical protein
VKCLASGRSRESLVKTYLVCLADAMVQTTADCCSGRPHLHSAAVVVRRKQSVAVTAPGSCLQTVPVPGRYDTVPYQVPGTPRKSGGMNLFE